MESVNILGKGTRQSESETLSDSEESAEAKAKENLKSKITKSSSKAKSFLSEKTPKAKHCVKGCCEKLFHWLIELFTTCFAWISQCFKSLLNMAMHNWIRVRCLHCWGAHCWVQSSSNNKVCTPIFVVISFYVWNKSYLQFWSVLHSLLLVHQFQNKSELS